MSKTTSIRVRLTPDRLERLDTMAAMMGMDRSSLIKLVLDDKWLALQDRGLIEAFKRLKENNS